MLDPSEMNSPKVSILMACYNSAAYLTRTIKSVLANDYQNWELIAVDDGSTDSTLSILQDYAKQDPRIKVFSKENGGNAAIPFNFGIKHASGTLISLLGHDDEYSSDYLSKTVERHIETGADIVIPDCQFVYPDPQKNWTMAGVVKRFGRDNPIVDRSCVLMSREAVALSVFWKIHAFALYNASLIKQYGYCEQGMNGDEYSARVFLFHSNRVVFSEGIYFYHQVEGSITKKIAPRLFDTWHSSFSLENLLKDNDFSPRLIKKVNQGRFYLYESLKKKYEQERANLDPSVCAQIEQHLSEHRRHLQRYRTFSDMIFRRDKFLEDRDLNEREIVLFNTIRLKYTMWWKKRIKSNSGQKTHKK